MRTRFLLFTIVLWALYSCVDNPQDFLEQDVVLHQTRNLEGDINIVATLEDITAPAAVPLQEIIIKYHPWVTEEAKHELRVAYDVVDYKTCDCSGPTKVYELWKMGPQINIEPTTKVIRKKNEDEVEMAVPNQSFTTPVSHTMTHEDDSMNEHYTNHNDDVNNHTSKIVSSNSGVSIAVLDTGIDPSFSVFSTPFLYDSSVTGACNEPSGYDFVNRNANAFDDDPLKHGSAVSYVIYNELTSRNIPFQILPVKVADAQGKSTFFWTFCGLLYAIHHNVDVINMSLGWTSYDPHAHAMFSQLIGSTSAIIVASAGNNDSDNDLIPHYPSNFQHSNVISFAASNVDQTSATIYSNYGANTVDFFAVGNKIYFPLLPTQNVVSHNGTSFAAPLGTSRVAELILGNYGDMIAALRQEFSVRVSFTKQVIYSELIE